MGLGAVGLELAESLSSKNGINVTVIDNNEQKVEKAVDNFDVIGVTGNGITFDTLKEAKVDKATIHNIQRYFVLYAFIVLVSIILVSIDSAITRPYGFMTSVSSVMACFNNVGPGFADVGPVCNYAGFGVFTKIVLTLDMLIGRLEIMPILLIFYPKHGVAFNL